MVDVGGIKTRSQIFPGLLPEISEFLVKLCDDDWLAGGGDDHLHVGLALPHLPRGLLAGAGGLKH